MPDAGELMHGRHVTGVAVANPCGQADIDRLTAREANTSDVQQLKDC
jgi:hypothetical protein